MVKDKDFTDKFESIFAVKYNSINLHPKHYA
nr:MAG TPA: hypothetical protein [Caudoviricetes sp.]